jgi:hypothetical protein
LIRDNLGLELGVSNSALATPTLSENINSFVKYHPNTSTDAVQRIRKIGEVRYNKEMQRIALNWIKEDPIAFASISAKRAAYFWIPPAGPLRMIAQLFTIGLATAGAVITVKRRRRMLIDLGMGCLGFSSIYYFIQFDPRYSYPIQWAVAIFAGVGLIAIGTTVYSNLSRRATVLQMPSTLC